MVQWTWFSRHGSVGYGPVDALENEIRCEARAVEAGRRRELRSRPHGVIESPCRRDHEQVPRRQAARPRRAKGLTGPQESGPHCSISARNRALRARRAWNRGIRNRRAGRLPRLLTVQGRRCRKPAAKAPPSPPGRQLFRQNEIFAPWPLQLRQQACISFYRIARASRSFCVRGLAEGSLQNS